MTLLEIAYEAANRAGSVLASTEPGKRTSKTDRDYATEADYRIEDDLREFLGRETPEFGFFGEERGHTGSKGTYWCLDPIDGTINYYRGLPQYAVSLAVIRNGQPHLGLIDMPAMGERYTGLDGRATLNGSLIRVGNTSQLCEAIVSFGHFATGHDAATRNAPRLEAMARLIPQVARIRMLGSAAIDLAWLAAGRLDAVIMHSSHAWDVAAGVAIINHAGGIVRHHDGTQYRLHGPNLLAVTPGLNCLL